MANGEIALSSHLVGHGIDLVEIAEFRKLIEATGENFLLRCFMTSELEEIGQGVDRAERLAGRFASKEAVLKALGTGFGNGIALTDVVISRSYGQPPSVVLLGGALVVARQLGITGWSLSISHTSTMACASALALSDCKG